MRINILLALLTILIISSCKEQCTDCDAALDHFYGKLAQNNCNPINMAEAVNRIREDCDDPSSEKIGYMAESCYNGTNYSTSCGMFPSNLSLDFDLMIRTDDINRTFPDDIEVIVVSNNISKPDRVAMFSANQSSSFSKFFGDDEGFSQGVEGEIHTVEIVKDLGGGNIELLHSETIRFTFDRNFPNIDRLIIVSYISSTQEYDLDFSNWN